MEEYAEIVDKYRLIECIGHGAQAKVYRACEKDTQKEVAIKICDIKKTTEWKNIELFKREVEILQRVNIDGIPKYIDYIEGKSKYYLIEEYFDALSIKTHMMKGYRATTEQIKRIMASAANILAQLHAQVPPIIHRDIKPSNILINIKDITHPQVYLIDLGAVATEGGHSQLGTIAGTLGYAPPEQFMGFASPASDVYGLGMTIVYMLTGKSPSDMDLDGLTVDYERYLPSSVPASMRQLLRRMLQPEMEERMGSMREVLNVLGCPVSAPPKANARDSSIEVNHSIYESEKRFDRRAPVSASPQANAHNSSIEEEQSIEVNPFLYESEKCFDQSSPVSASPKAREPYSTIEVEQSLYEAAERFNRSYQSNRNQIEKRCGLRSQFEALFDQRDQLEACFDRRYQFDRILTQYTNGMMVHGSLCGYQDHNEVVLKVFKVNHLSLGEIEMTKVLIELLMHTNVVGVSNVLEYKYDETEKLIYTIEPYIKCKSLKDIAKEDAECFNFENCFALIDQIDMILRTVYYSWGLEGKLIHGYINPENILVQFEGKRIKQVYLINGGIIGDLLYHSELAYIEKNARYMAPESFLRKKCARTDVYAVGRVVRELYAKCVGFQSGVSGFFDKERDVFALRIQLMTESDKNRRVCEFLYQYDWDKLVHSDLGGDMAWRQHVMRTLRAQMTTEVRMYKRRATQTDSVYCDEIADDFLRCDQERKVAKRSLEEIAKQFSHEKRGKVMPSWYQWLSECIE